MFKASLCLILLLFFSAGLAARAEQSVAPVPGAWEFRYQENNFRPDTAMPPALSPDTPPTAAIR